MSKTTYVWRPIEFDDDGNPTKNGWVPKPTRRHMGHYTRNDIDPYISPVDGSVISSSSVLREHNKRHGVTNDLDQVREAGNKELERSKNIRAHGTVHERKLEIADALERASSSGYHRRVQYDD